MRKKEIINAAKEHEKQSEFSDLAKSPLSRGVFSSYGVGFIDGAEWADANCPERDGFPRKDHIRKLNKLTSEWLFLDDETNRYSRFYCELNDSNEDKATTAEYVAEKISVLRKASENTMDKIDETIDKIRRNLPF
jgi:hypothetical protein